MASGGDEAFNGEDGDIPVPPKATYSSCATVHEAAPDRTPSPLDEIAEREARSSAEAACRSALEKASTGDVNCPICLEPLNAMRSITVFWCAHTFHRTCFIDDMEKKPSRRRQVCALCRGTTDELYEGESSRRNPFVRFGTKFAMPTRRFVFKQAQQALAPQKSSHQEPLTVGRALFRLKERTSFEISLVEKHLASAVGRQPSWINDIEQELQKLKQRDVIYKEMIELWSGGGMRRDRWEEAEWNFRSELELDVHNLNFNVELQINYDSEDEEDSADFIDDPQEPETNQQQAPTTPSPAAVAAVQLQHAAIAQQQELMQQQEFQRQMQQVLQMLPIPTPQYVMLELMQRHLWHHQHLQHQHQQLGATALLLAQIDSPQALQTMVRQLLYQGERGLETIQRLAHLTNTTLEQLLQALQLHDLPEGERFINAWRMRQPRPQQPNQPTPSSSEQPIAHPDESPNDHPRSPSADADHNDDLEEGPRHRDQVERDRAMRAARRRENGRRPSTDEEAGNESQDSVHSAE